MKVTKDILANPDVKFDSKTREKINDMYQILEGSQIKSDGKKDGIFDGDMREDSI